MSKANEGELVRIEVDGVRLEGMLALPTDTRSVVLFAHGSGSSRHSKRNRFVAQMLNEAGIGTLLFDLLTAEEDMVYENRFDIPLLAERLVGATKWFLARSGAERCKIGYFGASTGAAAALVAAAELGDTIAGVVSRGGRPDLAGLALEEVTAPTLLIVGGFDHTVIQLNQQAFQRLKALRELRIVEGATHLFEEPGTLAEAAGLARAWFSSHLIAPEK